MRGGRNGPGGAQRNFWLVPQIVLALLLVSGAVLLLLMGYQALIGSDGRSAPDPDEVVEALAEETRR